MGAMSYYHAITSALGLPQLFSTHQFLLAALFVVSLLLLRSNVGSYKKTCVPPSPSKLPIIGNLHQVGSFPHRALGAMAEKHGPIMSLRLGQVPALVDSSADCMAREIMKTQDHIFASRPRLKVPQTLFYEGRDVAFATHGEYWRKARKISVLHLLSPKMVQSYRLIREEEVAFMIEAISRSCCSGVMNMSQILSSFAKHTISRIVLGKCSREEWWDNIIHVMIDECCKMLGAFHVGDYFPSHSWLSKLTGPDARVRKIFNKVDEILDAIVDGHISRPKRDASETEDFVDILLSLEKEISQDVSFGKENIKAIVEDMFGAGTEATFLVTKWVLAELLRNPEVLKRLKDEIRGIVGSKPMVKEEDLKQMNYLKAVIKESMRLLPPGPFLVPRESISDTTIQGYHIPRKTRIFVNVWAIQRDPKTWEAPEEFRPEMFLGSSVDFKGHDFQLIPFGAGRRRCPGIGFAIPIIELAIANLMYHFHWKLPDGMKDEDLDMTEALGISMRRKSSLQLVATPCLFWTVSKSKLETM
ncbi:LOW QUALITY PROTEIN: cytochrome P450 71A1-like [Elaeis guineensis]|uniref:LOW QUALITY PROTEIN: cytochrome P450 71A1-like n=1 Tax=Elaeis guineensis var. tenera TaxID=51953 RepID=UPI003C6D070C